MGINITKEEMNKPYEFGVWWVFCKGWCDCGIIFWKYHYCFSYRAKDWWISGEKITLNNNQYLVSDKNPKYENAKVYSGYFPK